MLRRCLFTDPRLAVCSVAMWGFVEYVCDCFWICLIFFGEWIHPNGNIYSSAHVCQILQEITERDLEACLFFFLKKIIFFPKLVRLCYLYGSSFVWTDFRVSMPLSWFLSCWAHWFALNIPLSILYCRDKVRGNEPLHRNAVSVKKQKVFEWVKKSLFSCPHLSPVLSLVCLARVYEVRVWTPSKDQHWLCI